MMVVKKMKINWLYFFIILGSFLLSLILSFIAILRQPFPYPMFLFLGVLFSIVVVSLLGDKLKADEIQFSTNEGSWSIVLDKHVFDVTKGEFKGFKFARCGGYHFAGVSGGHDITIVFDPNLITKKGKLFSSSHAVRWSWNFLPKSLREQLSVKGCPKYPILLIAETSQDFSDEFPELEDYNSDVDTSTIIKRVVQHNNLLESYIEKQGMNIEDFSNESFFTYEQLLEKVGKKNFEKFVKKHMKEKEKEKDE